MDFGGPDAVVANASHWRLWPPVQDVQKHFSQKKKSISATSRKVFDIFRFLYMCTIL